MLTRQNNIFINKINVIISYRMESNFEKYQQGNNCQKYILGNTDVWFKFYFKKSYAKYFFLIPV
jgi:hypothetical protein